MGNYAIQKRDVRSLTKYKNHRLRRSSGAGFLATNSGFALAVASFAVVGFVFLIACSAAPIDDEAAPQGNFRPPVAEDDNQKHVRIADADNAAGKLTDRLPTATTAGLETREAHHANKTSAEEAGEGESDHESTSMVSFERDIQPLLADRCFSCHGPDPESREADLRLDLDETALSVRSEFASVDYQEVLDRITSEDPDLVMPPPHTGKPLSARAMDDVRQWIDRGAERTVHWSFQPPVRPALPVSVTTRNVAHPVDAFVLEQLEAAGLGFAPQADRGTWLRRLSLDLTGLPPTNEQVSAFIDDASESAHQQQIDRLLASPHFGERWARMWLDGARYADSDGYGKDKPRTMWFYRDWVVDALNADMPYDQFIVDQIAGDLREDADQASRIATGFLRNSMTPNEGGADPEEYRMKAMFDRMDAIGKGILGLSLECAQCHSHKTDPLSHDEYYSLFACINNTNDAIVPVYTPQEQHDRAEILERIAKLEKSLLPFVSADQAEVRRWEQDRSRCEDVWTVLDPASLPFEGTKYRELADHSILSEGYAPKLSTTDFYIPTDVQNICAVRLELLTDPELPRSGPGRSLRGTAAISEFRIFVAPADQPDAMTEVEFQSAWADVNPALGPQPKFLPHSGNRKLTDDRRVGPIELAIDGDEKTAWTTDIDPLRRNQPRVAVFCLKQPVGFSQGSLLNLKPIQRHGGWNNHDNHSCLIGRFRFSVSAEEETAALPPGLEQTLDIPPDHRSPQQRLAIWRHWRSLQELKHPVDDAAADIERKIDSLCQKYPEGTNQFVLTERTGPRRPTSVLSRGDFLSPLHPVDPATPVFLHASTGLETAANPRMALAKWMVERRSPTTARAIVNRIWQEYFGTGLLKTPGDLGIQSPPPSHRKLLDWLAVELMENGWRLKHIHRLITSSATYRQSGQFREETLAIDPDNRLLSRGPRGPVSAEMVHDIALAVSGLLNDEVGGPPVFPPIPRHLLRPPVTYSPRTWDEDRNPDRYRRALYTFRFRNAGHPAFETFDAPDGFVSCVRRNRSNTPMQSLVLLNEPLMMECAWALGELALENDCETESQRLAWMMQRCVAREPDHDEVSMLAELLAYHRDRIAAGEVQLKLVRRMIFDGRDPRRTVWWNGDANRRPVPHAERAAWMLVARALLSLDETVTKP